MATPRALDYSISSRGPGGLGTSGTLYAFTETPIIDPKGEISAFCDSTDHWLALACTMNVASAVDRLRDLFGWEMNALEKNVARSQPGANGLMFLPYFDGERLPNLPNGCGVIHGLNSSTPIATILPAP